ncbi:MAG: hypothetical protein II237_01565 [Clostridia bacterium]|nr:hypothetical protein [Clostridia bacterium]
MKKLLSLLLAVIMIFSCCTAAANALYLETVTEKEYVDNLLETVKTTEHSAITYESLNLGGLVGQDFIDAVTKIDATAANGVDNLIYTDSIGRPILDPDENPIYKDYKYVEKVTSKKEVLGIPLDFVYNNRGPLFTDNITANPNLKTVIDEIKVNTRNRKFAASLEALADLEVMLGIDDAPVGEEEEAVRELRRLADNIRLNLEEKKIDPVIEDVDTIRGKLDIKTADITLLFGNVNMFLLRMMKSRYSDFRFYTQKNAVKCINYIGNLFYRNFNNLPENFPLFTNNDYVYSKDGKDYVDEDVFFQRVAEHSKLIDLIQTNWVDYGDARANYKVLLNLIGITDEYLLPSEYYRGDKIAPAILKVLFTRIMGEGPLAVVTGLLDSLSKAYLIEYYTPIKLLFSQKAGLISEEELKTLDGLLNLIINDNDKGNLNKFQFAPLPEARLAIAENKSEFYLTLLIYFNLNAHYLNNENVIDNFVLKYITNNGSISGEDTVDEEGKTVYSDKRRLENIINGICGDNIGAIFTDITLAELMMENILGKPEEFKSNIGEAIARMIKKIADWFQMWIDIFTGKLEFGAGAFD